MDPINNNQDLKSNVNPPSTTPQLVGDYGSYFYYYVATRDPTDTEPDIYFGFPYISLVWWNTTTNDWFFLVDDTAVSLTWVKFATTNNFNSLMPVNLQNTSLNSARSYASVASPAFDTDYSPSATSDTFVLGNFNLSNVLGGSVTIDAQVDTGAGYVTVASTGLSDFETAGNQSLSFIVPAGAQYQFVATTAGGSAAPTLNNIQQLAL